MRRGLRPPPPEPRTDGLTGLSPQGLPLPPPPPFSLTEAGGDVRAAARTAGVGQCEQRPWLVAGRLFLRVRERKLTEYE